MTDAFQPPAPESSTHPVEVPGLEGRVAVTTPGLLSGAKIYVDGAPAPKGSSWGTFALPDGRNAALSGLFTRTTPSVKVDGTDYPSGEAIPLPLVVLAFLPIGLVAIGGALGGAAGGAGMAVNMSVNRQPWPVLMKVLAMLAVTVGSGVLWLVVAGGLALALGL